MENTTLNDKEKKVLEYIKKQIKDTGYPPSVREICAALGFKSTSSAHQYIWRLAEKGYIDKGDLKTRAIRVVGTESTISVPIVGKVAAGEPILATENIEDYMSIGESFFTKDALQNDNFILKVQGESMIEAGINDGDYIIVTKQSTARNGQIVVAMIEGEATVKTFYKEDGYIRLQPENSTMDPIIVKDCQILGKVIGLFRKGTAPTETGSEDTDPIPSVTNVKSTITNNNTVNLTWTGLSADDMLNLYVDDSFGTLGYDIYIKDGQNGKENYVGTTTSNSYTHVTNYSNPIYIIYTAYSNYKTNKSKGVEHKVQITTDFDIIVKDCEINTQNEIDSCTKGISVLYNSVDVTNKSTIKVLNNANNSIKYEITYQGKVKTVNGKLTIKQPTTTSSQLQ